LSDKLSFPHFSTDDLAGSVKLGERIQLIGRVYRSFPEKNQGTYLHGIQMDVNNVLHLPRRREPEMLSETIAEIFTSNMSPWNTSQAIVDLLGMFSCVSGLFFIWAKAIQALAKN
jgi:hypothetical protein